MTRANHLQALLDERLRSGAEPYLIVATALQNLRALRVVQIAQLLSPTHPCFASGSNAVIEGAEDVDSRQTSSYSDRDALTSIRVSVVPTDNNLESALIKAEVRRGGAPLPLNGEKRQITGVQRWQRNVQQTIEMAKNAVRG